MNSWCKIIVVTLSLVTVLLLAACSNPATVDPSLTPSESPEDNPGGVPLVLPTFTVPEPANINPGKILGTVYISDKDHRFHKADCPRLGISNTPINRQSAILQGYDTCPVCNP